MRKANIVFYGITAVAWVVFGIIGIAGLVNNRVNAMKPEYVSYTIIGFLMTAVTLFMMALNIMKKGD